MTIRRFDSMTGRIFVILLIGIALAGTLGLALSERRRVAEIRHIQAVRAIERTGAFLTRFAAMPAVKRSHEAGEERRFIRMAGPGDRPKAIDADLTGLLREQVAGRFAVLVEKVPVTRCDIASDGDASPPMLDDAEAARAWKAAVAATDCWRVTALLADNGRWRFVTGPPPLLKASAGPDPAFLIVIACAAGLLAFLVARIATTPLRTLMRAADRIDPDGDFPSLAEAGPHEVRSAIRAFNRMQRRIVRHAGEQTHMIAAITHDLQTPMTRMRLKLEQMTDDAARARLLSDWNAMRAIVEEGLELARSIGAKEQPVLLDVDSLIDSIVEDEREAGNIATFDSAAGRDWRCRPQMLRRCVQNLVDNAINYGGEAHLSTHADGDGLRIEIRDPGPGIPPDQLEAVFEPMVRLETSRSRSTGGTGLGLTIARNLARQMGATIMLANRTNGGLLCTIAFSRHPRA